MKHKHKTGEGKIYIKVPDWIYYGGGEVSLKYRNPDGEWFETTFYPIDSIKVKPVEITTAILDDRARIVRELEGKKVKIEPVDTRTAAYEAQIFKQGFNEALVTAQEVVKGGKNDS